MKTFIVDISAPASSNYVIEARSLEEAKSAALALFEDAASRSDIYIDTDDVYVEAVEQQDPAPSYTSMRQLIIGNEVAAFEQVQAQVRAVTDAYTRLVPLQVLQPERPATPGYTRLVR